jgi:hypothetical protein
VEYDGTDFLVVWQDQRDGERDLCGARVTRQGTVLDTFPSVTQQGYQVNPVLTRGSGNKMLLTYGGWTGIVDDVPYNSPRIWATLSPVAGMRVELTAVMPTPLPTATIVRNVLMLPRTPLPTPHYLFSLEGRKVLDLGPGANDVSRLSPGVYFTRGPGASSGQDASPSVVNRRPAAIRKVIVAR